MVCTDIHLDDDADDDGDDFFFQRPLLLPGGRDSERAGRFQVQVTFSRAEKEILSPFFWRFCLFVQANLDTNARLSDSLCVCLCLQSGMVCGAEEETEARERNRRGHEVFQA